MAVFVSFHYQRDSSRVQQVLKMGAITGQTILRGQDWESVKRQGDTAVQRWIHDQMLYKTVIVVLVGRETASRPWVRYEIAKAWEDGRPLVGVRIHGLRDLNGKTDSPGPNPFSRVGVQGGRVLDSYVPLYAPGLSTSRSTGT